MKDNELWLGVVGAIALVLCVLIVDWNVTLRKFADNGYCEVQSYGTTATRWVKCEVTKP
jgi:hypothetical protein